MIFPIIIKLVKQSYLCHNKSIGTNIFFKNQSIQRERSPMTTTIETDLKEILGKLDNHLERIDNRLSNLELNQIEIKGEIKILDEKLSGQINALDEKLSGQVNALDEKLSGQVNALDKKLSGQVNALDEKLSGQISTLDEKVIGIHKRLDNQEFINRGVLVGVILALFAGVVKLFGFFPNP